MDNESCLLRRHGRFLAPVPGLPGVSDRQRAFPIDSEQLAYLVRGGHIPFPNIDADAIWDHNKADGFARFVTILQMTWFFTQCLARWIQHLDVSSLEITTFAMIVASLNTLFFWYHKPLDAKTPITLDTKTLLADILSQAEDAGDGRYSRTPLDFLKSPPASTSLVAPFWFGVGVLIDFDDESNSRPIKSFGNCKTWPPTGITIRETIYGVVFECLYFGIHFAGWNQEFPTLAELYLWRSSNLVLLGLLVLYLVAIPLGVVTSRPFSRRWQKKEVHTPLEVAAQLPRWAQLLIHAPVVTLYILARSCILVEGFINLRALPVKAYVDISWIDFLPHS